jgi:putative transposase
MAHPYTPYCPTFSYVGKHRYFLTFVTYQRIEAFAAAVVVALVWEQILRAAREKHFEIIAYCFMPDHVHLVVEGVADDSDLKAFVKLAKQYAAYNYARPRRGAKLWQKGSNDHIIRDDVDLLERVRYVVNNPVAAKLVKRPEHYPFLGSQRIPREELIEWSKPGFPKRPEGGSPA